MGIVHPLLLPLAVGIAALAWRTVVQRGTRLRDGTLRLDRWAYWIGFVTLSLMITLPLPFVQSSVDGATRTPGLALYLQEVATLCTCWCWLSYLALIEGTRSRWQPAIFGGLTVLVIAAAAFMGLRFSIAPGHGDIARLGPEADLPTRYLAAQRLTYRAVMLLHAVYGSKLLRRYSAVVRSRPALWARMRAMTWVLDFMILYAVYECLSILCPPLPDFRQLAQSATSIPDGARPGGTERLVRPCGGAYRALDGLPRAICGLRYLAATSADLPSMACAPPCRSRTFTRTVPGPLRRLGPAGRPPLPPLR